MRRLLKLTLALVVVAGLLVALDRVAVAAAESLVAQRLQSEQHLSARPDVSIGGFPFLTQAIDGRYDDVTVTVRELSAGSLAVRSLTARLDGVHLPLGDVIGRHLGEVPVDQASAEVLLAYSDLDDYLAGRHLSVTRGDGGKVRVTGTVSVAGQDLSVSGQAAVAVRGSSLVLAVGRDVEVTIPLSGLPFGVRLLSASATAEGVVVTAAAEGLVLHPAGG